MAGDMKPFRIINNLYFVGTYKASSHLIDTGEGLILIDSGYEETADVIIESVAELGFDIRDVKYILHSHGHGDHTDGTRKLLSLTDAETFLGEGDLKYIKGWKPDHFYRDGQVIGLGNTNIRCLFTPGHTEATFSFFFDVEEKGQIYRVGMFGGAGTNQLKKSYLNRRGCSWLNRGLYFKSVERLKKERVDVFIGNHTWNNQTKEKYERMSTSTENPFIDDTEWLAFLEKCEKDAANVMLSEPLDQVTLEIEQPGEAQQIADRLRKQGNVHQYIVTSMRPECLRAIKDYAPEVHIGLLMPDITDEMIDELKRMGTEAVLLNAKAVTPEKVTRLHREGFDIHVWEVKE